MLVDYEIEELCRSMQMVEPFDPALINPASIDIRIGTSISIPYARSDNGWAAIDISDLTELNPYPLKPGAFILAASLETFNLPDFIGAQFVLKSSRAREGHQHCLAGFCDPGWHGSKLTMELYNVHPFNHLPIYPGLRIGQMVFTECNPPRKSYATTGRYNNDQKVQESRG